MKDLENTSVDEVTKSKMQEILSNIHYNDVEDGETDDINHGKVVLK